jgi:hypothetical protein
MEERDVGRSAWAIQAEGRWGAKDADVAELKELRRCSRNKTAVKDMVITGRVNTKQESYCTEWQSDRVTNAMGNVKSEK